jgi:hypothetical protein
VGHPGRGIVSTIARLIAAALLAVPFSGLSAQLSAPWFPFDTCTFLGNTIRGQQPGHLIAALDLRHNGRFWIQMAKSEDDGHTWRIAAVAAHDDSHDLWDPSVARLPDGSLILEFHGGGAMTILRSTDEGEHWSRATVFLGRFSEGYWQPLPPAEPNGKPRLGLLFAQTASTQTSTYFIRTTTDGFHWSDAVAVGDAGSIWDGTRAGLGPVEPDSGGIIHVAYSYRPAPADSVRLMLVTLDAHTLARRTPPDTLIKLRLNWKGIGSFPIVASCTDGVHVIYDGYEHPTGVQVAIWEITSRDPTPKLVVARGIMNTGFGRPWFVPAWSGVPALSWPELPNGPHTTIYSLPRPDLAHCAY